MVLKRLFGYLEERQKRERMTRGVTGDDSKDALLPMHMHRVICGPTGDELSRYLNFEDDGVWGNGSKSGGSSLDGCIKWSRGDGCSGSSVSIHIRNLEIELDSDGEVEIRYGRGLKVDHVDLYFENCFFTKGHIWPTGMKFIPEFEPEFERVEENSVDCPSYLKGPPNRDPDFEEHHFIFSKNIASEGCCSFSFPRQSKVDFRQNDFKNIFVRRYEGEEQSGKDGVSLNFMGNKFGKLELDFSFPFEYPVKCDFFGNEIDVLSWAQMVNRRKSDAHTDVVRSVRYDDVQEYNWLDIYFGWNKIISGRDLFVLLRKLAIERKDIKQEKIIDSHIDMVDYINAKKSKWSWRRGIRINEERIRLGWSWWSSRFYMSWLRPLVLLIGGYLILNAVSILWVDGYPGWDWSEWGEFGLEWLEFSVLSPKAIYDYVKSLEGVLDTQVGRGDRIILDVVGWLRWIWIILCGFAFGNAIKKK